MRGLAVVPVKGEMARMLLLNWNVSYGIDLLIAAGNKVELLRSDG